MEDTIYFGEGYKEYYDRKNFKQLPRDYKHNDPKYYYETAEYYRNNGDYEQAQSYYKKAYESYSNFAKIGYPEAFYFLGYFYQYGYGVDKNASKAEDYYTQAYNEFINFETNPTYTYLLGRLYESGFYDGKINKPDYKKAANYYGLSASYGYPDAYYRLGYVDALAKYAKFK